MTPSVRSPRKIGGGVIDWGRPAYGTAVVPPAAVQARAFLALARFGSGRVIDWGRPVFGTSVGPVPPPAVTPSGGGWPLPKRRPSVPDWRRRDEESAALVAEVRDIYERLVEGKRPAPKVAARIIATVEPFASVGSAAENVLPPVATIDFTSLVGQLGALDALLKALAKTSVKRQAQQIQIERDDMDAIELLIQSGLL